MPSKLPGGTATPAGWTPTGAATLHEAVQVSDDATSYAACTDGTACVLDLEATDNPNELSGHTLAVRAQKAVDTGQTVQLRAELMEGATVIATLDVADVDAAWTDYSHSLSEAEAAAIVDYSALSVRITDVDTPGTSEARVTLAELVVPERRLRVHCTG